MIRMDGVAVTYPGGVVGLQRTSLTFERREFVVLLGLSGAGKSTLLRTLNHLTRPTEGQVVLGRDAPLQPGRALREHRRASAMIFQQHQLIDRYSALQNVMMGRLGYYPSWRTLWPLPEAERVFGLQCLERVGLLDKALQRVDQLSGGQRQRVGIARALAQRPQLILGDEPVASLDPATARKVLDLIHRIAMQDSVPAVVSLHQLDLARAYADRIIGLSKGGVVFDGPPGQLAEADLRRIYGSLHAARAPVPDEPDWIDDDTEPQNTRLEAIG